MSTFFENMRGGQAQRIHILIEQLDENNFYRKISTFIFPHILPKIGEPSWAHIWGEVHVKKI